MGVGRYLPVIGVVLTSVVALAESPVIRPLTDEDYEAGFVLTRIGTEERFDFSAPAGAEVCSDWRRFGAARDWFRILPRRADGVRWSFPFGRLEIDALTIFSFGTVRPSLTNLTSWVSPLEATIGIAPEANINRLREDSRPCQFWSQISPSNTLIMTWQNVLLERLAERPVSFQVEFFPSGSMIFRYDLSRLSVSELQNVTVGIRNRGLGRTFDRLPTSTTSLVWIRLDPETKDDPDPDDDGLSTADELFVYGTDPYAADSDRDGLSDHDEVFVYASDPLNRYSMDGGYLDGIAARLAGTDPFALPDGSEYTCFEHVLHSGSVDGEFTPPQSDRETAVLEITALGEGAGELWIDGCEVPLLPGLCGMKLALARRVRHHLSFRGSDQLSVRVDSGDFCFGELDDRLQDSWIEFPNVESSPACIHTDDGESVTVELIPGGGAEELTCEWSSEGEVDVGWVSERSAELTARFPRHLSSEVEYRLEHPLYLFGRKVYRQLCRYCPCFKDEEAEDGNIYLANEEYSAEAPTVWCWCWEDCPGCSCPCHLGDSTIPSVVAPGYCDEHACEIDACEELHAVEYDQLSENPSRLPDVLKLHRPRRQADVDSIAVTVPPGLSACCACEDHQTNSVAVYEKSHRVALHLDGDPFVRTVRDCTLEVYGISPSRDFQDSVVSLCRTGEVYEVHHYTVLGVGIRVDGIDLETLNARDREFGMPVTINTDSNRYQPLRLQTDIGLPSGCIRLAFDRADARMRLWMRYYDAILREDRRILLLDSETQPELDLSLASWRSLSAYSTVDGETYVELEVLSSGSAELVYGFAAAHGGCALGDEARQRFTVVAPPLLADYDRNGRIDDADAAVAGQRSFRFWVNDDIWSGDDGLSDGFYKKLTGQDWSHNGEDAQVNGRCDLVNLLPLAIRVEELIAHWGEDIEVVVKGLQPNALRGCFADLAWSDIRAGVIGDIEADDSSAKADSGKRVSLRDAPLCPLNGEMELSVPLLRRSLDARGVLLVEAVQEGDDPLEIEVRMEGATVFSYCPRLHFARIDDMYRWHDIRPATDGSAGADWRPEEPEEPCGWPDAERDDSDFYFVHGYNVSLDEARQWGRAMFKRLWWSGLNSRYHVITWEGNDSQLWLIGVGLVSPDYHVNVEHALASANALTEVVKRGSGRKYLAAHSLGNMLVSAAIQDHALGYDRYFMLNAAVAAEAYAVAGISAESRFGMTPESWREIASEYRATHWFEHPLFALDDVRRRLTWRDRFASVDRAVNYYSSEEEVLRCDSSGESRWLLGRDWAWYNQERNKGMMPVGAGRNEGGWEFNPRYRTARPIPSGNGVDTRYSDPTPDEVAAITEDLREHPVFLPFEDKSLLTTATLLDLSETMRSQLLADAIPAESYPAGFAAMPVWELSRSDAVNADMAKAFKRNTAIYSDRESGNWGHSYFLGAPYMAVYPLYDDIVTRIKGDRE